MMAVFRKFGETKLSKVLLLGLAVCFGAWGIGGYLAHYTGASAITINGEDVSPVILEATYKQRVNALARMLDTQPTKDQLAQAQVAEQVVGEVVARTVLRQAADKLGLIAATKQLQDEIMQIPAFRGEDGNFDAARYRSVLAQAGRTPEQFERELGQDLIVRELAGLGRMEAAPASLIENLSALEDAKITLNVATLTPAMVGSVGQPSGTALEDFFKANEAVYARAETRDIAVMKLDREVLGKSISVPEKQVEDEYTANKDAYDVPETRVVRHILVDSKAEADKLRAGIKTLQDFAAAANAHSKDPGNQGKGGLLGSIQANDVVPAFRSVAFSMKPGEVSQPVQSPFGWHLIWVESIAAGRTKTFDEVKGAIAEQLQAKEGDQALSDLASKVDEKIAAGEALDKIGKELGVQVRTYGMVTAKEESLSPAELEAGFGTDAGNVAEPINDPDGSMIYVQPVAVNAAKVPPLAEVKERVLQDWQKAQVQVALQQLAKKVEMAASMPGAGSLSDVATKLGVNGMETNTLELKKLTEAPQWLQPRLLQMLPLPAGGVLPGAVQDGGNWHVVQLAARTLVQPDAKRVAEDVKLYQQRLQSDMESLLIGHLMRKARVVIHQEHMKQLFGREVEWDIGSDE